MIDLVLIWTKSYEGLFCKKSTIQQHQGYQHLRSEYYVVVPRILKCCKFLSAAKSYLFILLEILFVYFARPH